MQSFSRWQKNERVCVHAQYVVAGLGPVLCSVCLGWVGWLRWSAGAERCNGHRGTARQKQGWREGGQEEGRGMGTRTKASPSRAGMSTVGVLSWRMG